MRSRDTPEVAQVDLLADLVPVFMASTRSHMRALRVWEVNLPDRRIGEDQAHEGVAQECGDLARFDEVLTKNPNILKVSVIDEDLPGDNPDRKSEADVLEIFVRLNREGTPLSRSDLIFSMLKLNWKESAESLPQFVQEVNKVNSFEIDTDFVIRCLFAVSDLGTKSDLDRLRRKQNVARLRKNFAPCCDAVRSVLDAVA